MRNDFAHGICVGGSMSKTFSENCGNHGNFRNNTKKIDVVGTRQISAGGQSEIKFASRVHSTGILLILIWGERVCWVVPYRTPSPRGKLVKIFWSNYVLLFKIIGQIIIYIFLVYMQHIIYYVYVKK